MKVRTFTITVLIFFLSGCAVMNTSLQETAEIVKPGHLKFGAECGYGLDLTTTYFRTGDEIFKEKGLLVLPIYGAKAGIGLTNEMDINAKVWVSFGGFGSKFYLKHKIPYNSEKITMAVAPGITFVTTETDEEEGDIDFADINTLGGELPFIITYRVGKNLALTCMTRYSADFITIEEKDFKAEFILHRLGLIGGISLNLGPLYLRPDVGIEMATPENGNFGIAPIIAIGAGFDF